MLTLRKQKKRIRSKIRLRKRAQEKLLQDGTPPLTEQREELEQERPVSLKPIKVLARSQKAEDEKKAANAKEVDAETCQEEAAKAAKADADVHPQKPQTLRSTVLKKVARYRRWLMIRRRQTAQIGHWKVY